MRLFRTMGVRAADNGWTAFRDLARPSYAGVDVTQENAVNLPAVYRCWSLNADTISSVPVDCLTKQKGKRLPFPEPFWLSEPNDEQDWAQFLHMCDLSMEADGNAFVLKASNERTGQLVALYLLPPAAVKVVRDRATGNIVYLVGVEQKPYPATAILHIRWMVLPGHLRGLSPIRCMEQTIGTGFAAEQYGANFFGTGATVSGIVNVPGTLKDDDVTKLQENLAKKHGGVSKSHAIGVLTGGATWQQISVNPEDAQALQTRRFTAVELANIYGVPAEYVTEAEGAKGYVTGIFARQYMWLLTGMNPRFTRFERAFSTLLPKSAYLKFNRNSFLAMDPTERARFYAAGLRDRWIVPNEVREKEDMDPLPGGDVPLWSVQWQDATPTPEGGRP